MRRLLYFIGLLFVFSFFMASQASADQIINSTTPQELNNEYGSSGDAAVEAWANDQIVGDALILAPPIEYTDEEGDEIKEQSSGDGYDPQVGEWDYIVAKSSTEIILIEDDGDNLLQLDFDHAVSNIRPPSPVPEPSTMLLFGSGLIGLSVFAKRKIRKV